VVAIGHVASAGAAHKFARSARSIDIGEGDELDEALMADWVGVTL
jgi:hypothetical protein